MSDTGPASFRAWVKRQADELGVEVEDLLIQSKRRDPLYKGTDADHAKAQWFADLWQQAVAGRDGDQIHVRGVHYFIVMATGEASIDPERLRQEYGIDLALDAGADLQAPVEPPTRTSWGTYQNTETCYNYLEEAAKLARILGYVPLDGVIDRKHAQQVITWYGDHARRADLSEVTIPDGVDLPPLPRSDARADVKWDREDPEEDFATWAAERLAADLVDDLEFDAPSQAPFHTEVWCEKGLPDYIHRVCEDRGVNVVVEGQGDLSLTIAQEFAGRVQAAGKPAVVLYLSDFDPKGDNMATAMAGKLAWLKHLGELEHRVVVEQLAVTKDQVRDLDLPRKPIPESAHTGTGGKAYDTLVTDWEQRKGAGQTELNVLENYPDLYERIVTDGLAPYTDPDIERANELAIEQWRAEAVDALAEAIRESGLLGDVDELEEWIATFNDRLADAEAILEDLEEQVTEGYYREWLVRRQQAVESADLPVVEVPEGEGTFPEDPLYDSDREYVANVARVHQHKHE